MEIIQTPIQDLIIIKPRVFQDERGHFFETYNRQSYHQAGINLDFCQDNQSKSTYGVVRGLHYQLHPHSQSKLVTATYGKVWDVAVDLRKNSPTFGEWFGVELSAENKLQFLIPRGFAHGFSVLSKEAIFSYKCDNFFNQAAEGGIIYNDDSLNIDWKLPDEEMIISLKDQQFPSFQEATMNF